MIKSVLDLIGNTPLLDLTKNKGAKVYAKAEFQNPTGSIKDRMVNHIIQQAENRGELKPGQTIVEATSGNTGVSLAMVSTVKGYDAVIVAPDSTSNIKKKMIMCYGAELILTDNRGGIKETLEKAQTVAKDRGGYLLNQFKNPDNPKAHHVTGNEILQQMGVVDKFVAGVGTGGTLIGVGETLKNMNPYMSLVAIEPHNAPALYNLFYKKRLPMGEGIPHEIEGIGETFISDIILDNLDLIDDVILVNDGDAFHVMRQLGRDYGYCVGVSSGANVFISWMLARTHSRIVTILPDTGQRYLGEVNG